MNQTQSSPHKLFTVRLSRYLELALRSDEFIEISSDEALVINEVDKEHTLCYIEFPDDHNRISKPRLWNIYAWRASVKRHEQARRIAAQNKIEFENYKTNISLIAEALSSKLGMPATQLTDMALKILKKNPENVNALGVQLVHPYYRGTYIILPTKGF